MRIAIRLLPVLLLAALVSCGSDDGGPDAQPAPEDPGFAEGLFDQLPHPPGSEPVGPKAEEQGVNARSYKVDNATPLEVMEFYEDALADDWREIEEVHELGESENAAYRGKWQRDEWVLVVTASEAPTVSGTETGEARNPTVQYSLSLEPLGREGTP